MSVPVLDLSEHRAPPFVAALHDALHTWGFVGLVGHGLPEPLLNRAYALAAALFALPESSKRACETAADGRQRGWTPFRVEHAKDSAVGDLKEFWHVGREDVPGLPVNRYPAELSELAPVATELFTRLDDIARTVLSSIAVGLDLPSDTFHDMVRTGNSVLRILYYPPLVGPVEDGAIRAAPHEDINLLTLLPVATAPGLEILTPSGTWLPVDPPAGAIVCDTGDMMQLLTGGRLRSTTHRVVNPTPDPRVARYSLPFFVHPRPDVRLDALGGTTVPITAGEYLAQRLRETGVAG